MPGPSSFIGLERTIGILFRDKDLLAQALTHRSAIRERKQQSSRYGREGHNERLEFLGDAVLELAVTEFLFSVSDRPEGELTNWRAALVRGVHLSTIARQIGIGDYLFMSRGEEASGGREKDSTLANSLEALIGGIYLDQGFDKTREFIDKFILSTLRDILERGEDRDPKSILQEISQEKHSCTPTYRLLKEDGPDHDKIFTVAVEIEGVAVAEGTGTSKQRAELDAAERALKLKKWKK
jgi:ribonuclease III